MNKLLIATANAGKVAQYRAALSNLPVELVTVDDLHLGGVEETGKTFEENVLLKVRAYHKLSGLPCIGDDGGLEIDALNGEPGVYSRRWKTGDESATDQELIDYTIEKMKDIPEGQRSARFTVVMAFVDADGKEFTTTASTEGFVPLVASKEIHKNLPFDSVLFIPQFNRTRSELSEEEHDKINQRVLAIQKLMPIISKGL